MRFTLIHPSRGRANQARGTLNIWLQKMSGQHEIEHLLSVDSDDPEIDLYKAAFTQKDDRLYASKILVGNNADVVQATNKAAKLASGDVLIYLSDDFHCPPDWDALLYQEIADKDPNDPWLLKVHDDLQPFNNDVLTIPIMSKGLLKKLGDFWCPLYKSMFVDQDLYWVCKLNDWLIFLPGLVFEHRHYSNGKAPKDETYTRSDLNWNKGQAVYVNRKRAGFPIPYPSV